MTPELNVPYSDIQTRKVWVRSAWGISVLSQNDFAWMWELALKYAERELTDTKASIAQDFALYIESCNLPND